MQRQNEQLIELGPPATGSHCHPSQVNDTYRLQKALSHFLVAHFCLFVCQITCSIKRCTIHGIAQSSVNPGIVAMLLPTVERKKREWGFFLADVLWQGGGEIVFTKRKWLILYFILFYFCSCRLSVDKWVLQSWYIFN